VRGLKQIVYGSTPIDLERVEQLVDQSQTRALGELIHCFATRYADGRTCLREALERLFQELEVVGFDALGPRKAGNLALPRAQELAAAINRMRTLKVRQR